ncbi:SGNH hydrolase domain-containing protein [Puniceibacterium sediminis]|uniref:SGNH domain-containing protein n=1 Tax=Puniceibacterium sediminis TaxID=1608407 RepID=A0A238ZQR4_9RHOB|nr:SGNH hydrolase domain-containing protein [Puniceibacterium sediminis]SNR85529.1 hypothetical protein SAMN06265370_13717 [Puniceibacterium sediminis]
MSLENLPRSAGARVPCMTDQASAGYRNDIQKLQVMLRAVPETIEMIGFYGPVPDFCKEGQDSIMDGSTVLYFNSIHVSLAGARPVVAGLGDAL